MNWLKDFQKDLDADVGGGLIGQVASGHVRPAADVSADDQGMNAGRISAYPATAKNLAEEAPPALKARATHLMNQAGLAKPTRQAVIMFRCGTLSDPTKADLMQLVRDLEQGATHDALLAEIADAARAGKPLGKRALEMIPSDVPNAEPPPEDAPDGDDIPF